MKTIKQGVDNSLENQVEAIEIRLIDMILVALNAGRNALALNTNPFAAILTVIQQLAKHIPDMVTVDDRPVRRRIFTEKAQIAGANAEVVLSAQAEELFVLAEEERAGLPIHLLMCFKGDVFAVQHEGHGLDSSFIRLGNEVRERLSLNGITPNLLSKTSRDWAVPWLP